VRSAKVSDQTDTRLEVTIQLASKLYVPRTCCDLRQYLVSHVVSLRPPTRRWPSRTSAGWLLSATEKLLAPITARAQAGKLSGAAEIGLAHESGSPPAGTRPSSVRAGPSGTQPDLIF
jgi:hypothetical protein